MSGRSESRGAGESRSAPWPVLVIVLALIAVAGASAAPPPPRVGTAAGASAAPPPPRVGAAADENDDSDNAARRASVNATAKLALAGGTVQVIYPLLPANGPDAAALAALPDGAVLELTRSMAIKLKTEVELRFAGELVARTANVSPGYPGVYSLWLRRAGDGWRLVVNREPDIWGTMRDRSADVGETALAHETVPADAAKATFEATLVATDGGGDLALLWGRDRFVVHFEAGPGMAAAAGAAAERKGASP